MHVYAMEPDALARGIAAAKDLAGRIGAEQPELAALLVDLIELATKEMLVHACHGDRSMAERLFREGAARRKG
jgi:hypothetical protein